MDNPITSAGKTPKVKAIHAVALYEAETGQIRHMHHAIVLDGGAARKPESIEREARTHAARIGVDHESLKALHLPNHAPLKARFSVDLASGRLVERPLPAPPRGRRRAPRSKSG